MSAMLSASLYVGSSTEYLCRRRRCGCACWLCVTDGMPLSDAQRSGESENEFAGSSAAAVRHGLIIRPRFAGRCTVMPGAAPPAPSACVGFVCDQELCRSLCNIPSC